MSQLDVLFATDKSSVSKPGAVIGERPTGLFSRESTTTNAGVIGAAINTDIKPQKASEFSTAEMF